LDPTETNYSRRVKKISNLEGRGMAPAGHPLAPSVVYIFVAFVCSTEKAGRTF